MSWLYPIVAIIGEASGHILDKLNFKKYRIKPEQLLVVKYFMIVAGLSAIIILMSKKLVGFSFSLAGLIVIMIVVSFFQNLFDKRGLSQKNLSLREPIYNFKPILSSFLCT